MIPTPLCLNRMMISKSFNKAQREAGKIKAFNEAEEKLQKQGKKEVTI